MDKLYYKYPTAGALTMQHFLKDIGLTVNVKRIRRLMKVMGISAIYPQTSLSKCGEHKYVRPYLLRNLTIDHSNQVWSTDISYIPVRHGFMYLFAIMDVYSRTILSWKLTNTLNVMESIEILEKAVNMYGKPDIINSDQGSQYTSEQWTQCVENKGIKLSMDGKGRCKDNIWIERFWRTIKREYIYLYPDNTITQLRAGINNFMLYYNTIRHHQGINGEIPIERFLNNLLTKEKKVA